MEKFKKIIKTLFIAFAIIILLFVLILFISSLFQYKESDFDIPKNFFDSGYTEEQINSDKNIQDALFKFSLYVGAEQRDNNGQIKDIQGKEHLQKLLGIYDAMFKCRNNEDSNQAISYCMTSYNLAYEFVQKNKDIINNKNSDIKKKIINKIGEEKFYYLEKYFKLQLEDRELNSYNQEYSLNRKDFNDRNILRNDINIFFEYLKKSGNIELLDLPNFYWWDDNYYSDDKEKIKIYDSNLNYDELITLIDKINLTEIHDLGLINKQIYSLINDNNLKSISQKYQTELEKFIKLNEYIKSEFFESDGIGFNMYVDYINNDILKELDIYNNKEFFVTTPKSFAIYTYNGILSFTRSLLLISDIYIQNGEIENGMKLSLFYQEFLDNFYNKAKQVSLIDALVIIQFQNLNYSFIESTYKNYEINDELSKEVLNTLEKELSNELIVNSLKKEKLDADKFYGSVNDLIINFCSFIGDGCDTINMLKSKFLFTFLYSKKETLALNSKFYYDSIENKGDLSLFSKETYENLYGFAFKNPNNIIGRIMLNGGMSIYSSQFKKEENLKEKRQNLIKLIQEKMQTKN